MKTGLLLVVSFLLGGLSDQTFGRAVPCSEPEGFPKLEDAWGRTTIKICTNGYPKDPTPREFANIIRKIQAEDPKAADEVSGLLSGGKYPTADKLMSALAFDYSEGVNVDDVDDRTEERSKTVGSAVSRVHQAWLKEFNKTVEVAGEGENIFDPKTFNQHGMVNEVISKDLEMAGVQCREINGSLRGFKVRFSDGFEQVMIPLKMEQLEGSKNKWKISYRVKGDGGELTEVNTTELYIPDGNGVPISWKAAAGSRGKYDIPKQRVPILQGEELFSSGVIVGGQKTQPMCVAETSLEKLKPAVSAEGGRQNELTLDKVKALQKAGTAQ